VAGFTWTPLFSKGSSQTQNEYLHLPPWGASLWNSLSYAAGVRVAAEVLVVAMVTAMAVVRVREMEHIMIHRTI